MAGRISKLFTLLLFVSLVAGMRTAYEGLPAVHAQDEPPAGQSPRTTTIQVSLTEYTWWLVNWRDNNVECELRIDHEGLPTNQEINEGCGWNLYLGWLDTQPCTQSAGSQFQKCKGYYLFKVGEQQALRPVNVELPPPTVWLSVEGCTPIPPENRCSGTPRLLLAGEESLPNERIIRIQGEINGEPFSCAGSACLLPAPQTGSRGTPLTFWADSSFGDSSQKYTALVRIQPEGDFMAPEGGGDAAMAYYVDVLSTQWRGSKPASCAEVWGALPEVGGPPQWLTTPASPADLATSVSYYYLAGRLIQNGEVDASMCPSNGMETEMIASECGLQAALPKVVEWQNRFDEEIYNVAWDTGIPAYLLKNIFARESQLWPGIYKSYKETGLGQMTENGADTVLFWNKSFFDQFCPLVLSNETCSGGFIGLSDEQRELLRGALVREVNAACPSCSLGIDLTQAHFSVGVFANTLLANCEQVGQMIYNLTDQQGGQIADYTDLWRLTLANYNAGPGCLGSAMLEALENGDPLTWEAVAGYLEPACQNAINYVADITQSPLQPSQASWVNFNPAQMVEPTPAPQEPPAGDEETSEEYDGGDELPGDEEPYP